jgi:hypothetical protein
MVPRAGVPGVLQAREVFVGERMGSLVVHFRWTMCGLLAWAVWSPKGSYLCGVVVRGFEVVWAWMGEGGGMYPAYLVGGR